MKLQGDAFTGYAQLSPRDRPSYQVVKEVLYSAFAPDSIGAYEEFIARKPKPGEEVDVFLADLRRLSSLFSGVSDRTLVCSFIAGLRFHVRAGAGSDHRQHADQGTAGREERPGDGSGRGCRTPCTVAGYQPRDDRWVSRRRETHEEAVLD